MTTSLALALGSLAALLGTWLGYPVAIRLWAAAAPSRMQPDYSTGAGRSVSIILATRESAAAILARVANLLDTDHPAPLLQVVVALDADGARATAADLTSLPACAQVVIGDQPGGKACALNAGVRAATGEMLVMADTAQRFDRRTIPELVAHLEDARFAAVSGALELGGGRFSPIHWYWRLEKWLRCHEAVVHSAIGVTGAVYAVRRDRWPVIPPGTLLDDVYVPMALLLRGWRVGFTYSARATDVRAFSASAEQTRKARTMTGLFQLHRLLPDVLTDRNPLRFRYMLHKLARLTTPLWVVIAALGTLGAALPLIVLYPRGAIAAVVTTAAIVVVTPPLRRLAIGGAGWAFSMQMAVIKALRNGVTQRWSVWQDDGRR